MMVFANSDATCTIEATVVSGFETVAASEIEEKLGVKPKPLYDDYDTFKGKMMMELGHFQNFNLHFCIEQLFWVMI